MGRNKLIYCLSDAVVVVAATKGSGGTWAGAEEALRAKWVTVVVRARESPTDADQALVAMGARQVTEDDLAETDASAFLVQLAGAWADESDRPTVMEDAPEQVSMFGLPVSLPPKGRKRTANK